MRAASITRRIVDFRRVGGALTGSVLEIVACIHIFQQSWPRPTASLARFHNRRPRGVVGDGLQETRRPGQIHERESFALSDSALASVATIWKGSVVSWRQVTRITR